MRIIISFILGVLCGMAGARMEPRASAPRSRGYTVVTADSIVMPDGTRIFYDHKKNWQPRYIIHQEGSSFMQMQDSVVLADGRVKKTGRK
jgi:hypothetical protein